MKIKRNQCDDLSMRIFLCLLTLIGLQLASQGQDHMVERIVLPEQGVQPQVAADASGRIHLVYHRGEPGEGNLYYSSLDSLQGQWATPIQVNQLPESVVATGTVRGHQIAVTPEGRVHVSWFANRDWHKPKGEPAHAYAPLMVATLKPGQARFSREQNLLSWTRHLDGGGSLAVDSRGNLFVAWHGRGDSPVEGEMGRQVFMSVSVDGGETFSRERAIAEAPQGVCSCCGMRVHTDQQDGVHILYRGLRNQLRPMVHLQSTDHGKHFTARFFDDWDIQACPMSLVSMADYAIGSAWIANECEGTIRLHHKTNYLSWTELISSQQQWKGKHPSLVANKDGEVLVTWAQDAGWGKGGQLRWAVVDASGKVVATNEAKDAPELPVWSFASAMVIQGKFKLIY